MPKISIGLPDGSQTFRLTSGQAFGTYPDVGVGMSTGTTSKVDINGVGYSQLRLRIKFTPTSTSDSRGNAGDFSWDDNYFYLKTTNGWKRVLMSNF